MVEARILLALAVGSVKKYYYEEEFCGEYRQLMPIAYEKDESGEYKKTGMACESKTETCDLTNCKHFQKAPSSLPINLLRDSKIG